MKYAVIAAFGSAVILVVSISLISPDSVFADGYEKSQAVSQVNECGNYWFPVNIICSNINSQAQDDGNNVVVATAPDTDTNYGPPFP
ncbi:MAG: hypothetical protein ACRD5J_18395 [Nitrososphaeraceae archaeon]